MSGPHGVPTTIGPLRKGDTVLIGWGKLGAGTAPSLSNCFPAEVLGADADEGITLRSPRGKVWTVGTDSRQLRARVD